MKKILISLIFFLSCGLYAQDYNTKIIAPFGTLNNTDNSVILPDHMAQDTLNVDITKHGSVKKREGYGLAYTTNITTSPMHGVYHFYDSGGNNVSLFFNDRDMMSELNGVLRTLFQDKTFGATYQCTDSEGYAYCVNSNQDGLFKTDGLTYSSMGPPSTGTMITSTVERLAMAGISGALNRIDFSEANDFADWTPAGLPTDPIQFTVVSPGSQILHITYAFGRVMWFKSDSFGYILEGPTHADWTLRIVSHITGTLTNTSVYHNGILYFQGQDSHVYAYDGATLTKLSLDIANTIDFTQNRTINAWSQTTQSDWESGTVSTPTWLSTTLSPGSLVLATNTAVSDFVDTTRDDFRDGDDSDVSTTHPDDSVSLKQNAHTFNNFEDDTDCEYNDCSRRMYTSYYQPFLVTEDVLFRSVELRVTKTSVAGNADLQLRADDSGLPGSVLTSKNNISLMDIQTNSFDDWETFDFLVSGEYPLTAGTTYWIGWADLQNADNVYWQTCRDDGAFACVPDADGLRFTIDGVENTDDDQFLYRIKGSSYNLTGEFISQTFDAGSDTNTWTWEWEPVTIGDTEPAGSTITFQVQTSTATDGGWETLVTIVDGGTPSSSVSRYIRYKATLAGTKNITPQLDDFTIPMTSRIRPGATFYSVVRNADNIVSWLKFEADKQDNDGTHAFYVRSHATSFPVLSSTIAWTSVSPGDIPTVSTAAYFQLKDEFSVTKSTQNPKLDAFSFRWYEGIVSDKAYAIYFKDAIWWSVASGAGATSNNYILRLDLINRGWTLYDLGNNGMYVKNTDLYFGSPDSGYIYQFGGSNDDNGSAINAFWKSKDYPATSLFVEKEFNKLSIAAGSVVASSVTVTYEIDGSSSTSYTVFLEDANSDFIKNNRNLAAGRAGQTINFKIGNNAIEQPFEIFGIQFGYRSKPWRPTE